MGVVKKKSLPRDEYPRPQFARKRWECLNGEWEFEVDVKDRGIEKGMLKRRLKDRIVVPFCPESSLSGLERRDFMNAVWYRRRMTAPAAWAGSRIMLNFQAVDYDATVWVDGKEVGRHRGGWNSFSCDITDAVKPGRPATLVVRARDDVRLNQPAGKQCKQAESWGCFYTRTTGIWQTVWMEPVPELRLMRPRITPDAGNRRFVVEMPLSRNAPGFSVKVKVMFDGVVVAEDETATDGALAPILTPVIPKGKVRLWQVGKGQLYDLEFELVDRRGRVIDRVWSYAGLRSITLDGKSFKINGRSVFQRLVLDQGYYPDGIMTAPSDKALKADIEMSLAAGFNGARLHQKVVEERFLYHADRLGYLLWSEFGDCGFDTDRPPCAMITQWLEAIERDYNHPSIIGWCALTETIETQGDKITELADLTRGMFLAAKAADMSRPVLDCSGGSHFVPESDISDLHDYVQEPAELAKHHAGLAKNKLFPSESKREPISIPYRGQPFFLSEFGGIWWNPEAANDTEKQSWGYGNKPKDLAEFYARFQALCHVLLDNPAMFGYCYTQLTDIYQEQNGIYYFDRRPKFDPVRLAAIQGRRAAIERDR